MANGSLITITFNSVTNIPRDQVVNTWAVDSAGQLGTGVAYTAMDTFYNGIENSLGLPIASFMSNAISRANAAVIKVFDLSEPEPREPYEVDSMNLAAAGSYDFPLPDEVAVCLSFAAEETVGTSTPSRRGRIFLGPLNSDAIGTGGDNATPRVSDALQTCLVEQAQELFDISGGVMPAVWSRKDDIVRPATVAWVDNAWDSQRRRGRDATARLTNQLT